MTSKPKFLDLLAIGTILVAFLFVFFTGSRYQSDCNDNFFKDYGDIIGAVLAAALSVPLSLWISKTDREASALIGVTPEIKKYRDTRVRTH